MRHTLINATIVDGTGAAPRVGDLSMVDGRIVEGAVADAEMIDATGLVVAPGFVDLHTHVDFTLPVYPRAASMVRQGVTTLVMGNCGSSPFPLDDRWRDQAIAMRATASPALEWSWHSAADFRDHLAAKPLAPNAALLVGHAAVRIASMGFERRPPTPAELDRMRHHVAEAFDAGAFGLSTGLAYAPAIYADLDEVVALAEVAAAHGGFYTSHVRNEADGVIAAVDEALEIGRRTGIPVHISHHKALDRANWGAVETTLGMIDAARSAGQDVTLDVYPYTASSTTLFVALPRWTLDGGPGVLAERLRDPATRAAIRHEILTEDTSGLPRLPFIPEHILVAAELPGPFADLSGRFLSDAAADRGEDPLELMFDLVATEGSVEIVSFGRIGEDDLRTVLRHPATSVASDGWTLDPEVGGRPHPRSYGTFVRVLGEYVRDQRVLDLPTAIHKMTALPAARLGLTDRGVLAEGMVADAVVFDPDTVADAATFEDPHRFAVGVHHVFVGGEPVIRDGEDTGRAPGRVLRRT